MNEDGSIQNISNQITRTIYIKEGDVKTFRKELPKQKEVEISTIDNVSQTFKDFIKSIDTETTQLTKKEVINTILNGGSGFSG